MDWTRWMAGLAALSGLLFLSGCGVIDNFVDDRGRDIVDDRGGGGQVVDSAPDPSPDLADASSADPERSRDAGAQAATALPKFGSVTQSSSSDGSGVTTDTASASFDGRHLRVTVDRRRGSSLRFDSATNAIDSADFDPATAGYSGRVYALVDPTDKGISTALVHTRWNDADPTDYLAGGYWIFIEADLGAPDLFTVGVGVFVDGPELTGTPTLPDRGTASYRGMATGLYAYVYGSGHARAATGSAEIGEYSATATLNADFAADTVSGCIGCTGGMTVSAIGTTAEGEEFESVYPSMPARMNLGPAAFDADGTFSNRDVGVEIDGRTIDRTSGAWGGRFSTVPDAAGAPRLVGGTAGAEWSESDGSQGVFVGTYFGTTR